MKKIVLAALLITVSASAFAHGGYGGYGGYRGYGYRGGYGGWSWGPVIGGAIAGAVIYDIYNRPVVQPQPVIVQQPVYIQQTVPVNQQPVGYCPEPYQPFFNRVWVTDQYGRTTQQEVLGGCR